MLVNGFRSITLIKYSCGIPRALPYEAFIIGILVNCFFGWLVRFAGSGVLD